MRLYKGIVESGAVAGFTSLYVRPLFRTFMVAGLAWNIVIYGMARMWKNHSPTRIGQEHSPGNILARDWQDIPYQGYG